MFNNKKSILILITGLLILTLLYYNQNIQQSSALNSESNLTLMETEIGTESLSGNSRAKDDNIQIVVHLAGAVKNAGVYRLYKSDRLVDLIRAAGGLKENADLKQINLAENLYDGQKLTIPEIIKNNKQRNIQLSDSQKIGETMINNYSSSSNSNLININQADQNELEKLSGIGPSKAAAIIKYREQNNYFNQKEDLLKISGIGEKTLQNIKEEIVLQ